MTSHLEKRCRAKKLKMYPKRRAILELLEAANREMSAQEIVDCLHAQKIGRSTVYRTMNVLLEAGILRAFDGGDGVLRFESSEAEHHDRLVSVATGEITSFNNSRIEPLLRSIAEDHGYQLVDYKLQLFVKSPSN